MFVPFGFALKVLRYYPKNSTVNNKTFVTKP